MLSCSDSHWPSFLQIFKRQPSTLALLGLFMLMYLPLLWHWTDGWLNKSISLEHEYFSHGLLGIPLATYIAWEKRHVWFALPQIKKIASSQLVGGGILLASVLAYMSGMIDVINLSLPLMLAGLCLWLKGTRGLRIMAVPLILVTLATPNELPYLIAPYALPLQQFIAGVAGFILFQLGIDVEVFNIYLYVNERAVEVAPHCAGLKMLFTSLYVALALLYWSHSIKHRQTILPFLVGTATISVTANIIRNTLLSYFHGTDQTAAFVWLHDSWGGDLYSALMLGSLIPLLQLVDRWFIPQKTPVNHPSL
ncbi:MAG: cyanoexosortase B [Cyanobacteria bacterium P01_F01_bin.150]